MTKYSAIYFGKTAKIIKKLKPQAIVTLQFFQRQDNVMLAGIDEAISFLKKHTNFKNYKIKALKEGAMIQQNEVVLELEGHYFEFGLYEGVIDGILSRASSLATNAHHIFKATSKPIIYMGDRADHYSNQERDGYAIALGGIKTQVTLAHTKLHKGTAVGTMPHVLIQMFNGNTLEAAKAYHQVFPQEKLTVLVDFNNDVVNDTLKCLQYFKEKLHAVRVDTSANMVDKMFSKATQEYGVTPNLIKHLRKTLDSNGGRHVKIIISSGLNLEKIRLFEKKKTPVDIYGVGAWLLKLNISFTADAVKLNNKQIAKAGRKYNLNKKLKLIK